jgi:hypothetical protein
MANLTPSATRSALVQQLLQQSQQNAGRGAYSVGEALHIASAPILAAILGRQEEKAQQIKDRHVSGQTQNLVDSLSGGNDLAADQFGPSVGNANPASLAAALQSNDPGNPLAELAIQRELTKDERAQASRAAEADIARTEAETKQLTAAPGDPATGQRIVHSRFIGENGNVWFLNAFSGQPIDTGAKASDNFRFIEDEGGGVIAVSPSDPNDQRVVITPEEAQERAADLTGATVSAREEALERLTPTNLRGGIESLTSEIGALDSFRGQLERGELQTGPISQHFPAAIAQIGSGGSGADLEDFQAHSGDRIFNRIGEATFGALSEGEREFIRSTVEGRGTSEEGNIQIMDRKIFGARRARARFNEQALERDIRSLDDLSPDEVEDLIALQEGEFNFENFNQ